jgi:hypothetical protein
MTPKSRPADREILRDAAHVLRLDRRDWSKETMVAHAFWEAGVERSPFVAQNRRSGSRSTHAVIKHRRRGAARSRPKAHGTEALLRDAAMLIAWQHQDIRGISQSILTQTRTPLGTFNIPKTWPTDRRGATPYDLVFVFDRRNLASSVRCCLPVMRGALTGQTPCGIL